MCGRFVLSDDADRLSAHYGLNLDTVPLFRGGYNIAPSMPIPVLRGSAGRELALCRWGFIPHWATGPGPAPINARAETLSRKPWFRDSFRRRRCLVPANGYYEWRPEPGGKQPYFISMADGALFSFAGLWSSWQGPDGPVDNCAIITTTASEALADIHERMPVIISPEDYDAWLGDGEPALLRPWAGELTACPISPRVNNTRHQGEELIRPLG